MSQELHTALTNILAMPYYKNEHAHSGGAKNGHEDAVAIRIKDAGFIEVQKKSSPKLSKKLLKQWATTGNEVELREACLSMPVGAYIVQPAGSQGFPDILVRDHNDRFIALECKSGQGVDAPMWNDNAPKPNAIYILASGSRNETTVFIGKDVFSSPEQIRINKLIEDWNALTKICKADLLAMDSSNRGFWCNARPQYNQYGGAVKTNYFTHANRKTCETNALLYAND